MKIRELLQQWQAQAASPLTAREYAVKLPVYDAARIEALAELFPARTKAQIITELLGAALDELSASLPYVQGTEVVAEDELGDPIYADAGLTPRFHQLTRSWERGLMEELRKPPTKSSS